MIVYGANGLPAQLSCIVRPADAPDLPQRVAQYVAQICAEHGITEQMIADIQMAPPMQGRDEQGDFSHVQVTFSYR